MNRIISIVLVLGALVSSAAIAQTKQYDKKGRVTLHGPGDFAHDRGSAGQSNVTLGTGEKHTVPVNPGDRITKSPSTRPAEATKK